MAYAGLQFAFKQLIKNCPKFRRELDKKEIITIDRSKILISLEINKPDEYAPKYHSKYFTYGSLRKIDPDKYIGLNNAESRKCIESWEALVQANSEFF